MTDMAAHPVDVDARDRGRGLPAAFEGGLEDDPVVGGDVDPGVVRHLLLELPRSPARITQGDQRMARPLAARDRLEDVARGGDADVVGDPEGDVPVAVRL